MDGLWMNMMNALHFGFCLPIWVFGVQLIAGQFLKAVGGPTCVRICGPPKLGSLIWHSFFMSLGFQKCFFLFFSLKKSLKSH
jgi:hypothetical protein